MGQLGSTLISIAHQEIKMLSVVAVTLFAALANAQYYYTQPSYYYGQYPQRYTQQYTPYVYQATAPATPTQYSKQKERIDIIMKDIEEFILSIANAASVPGSSNFEWLSDEEFAAYREKQNQIFKTSGDLSAQLSGLKFY